MAFLAMAALAACAGLPRGDRDGAQTPLSGVVEPWLARVQIPPHLEPPPRETETAIAEDVHALLHGDFSVYPTAARRLVKRGEVVVPYLGFMGEQQLSEQARTTRIPIVLKPLLLEAPPDHVGVYLVSPYKDVRAAAAVAAGERRISDHATKLVELLDDSEVEVRRAAVTALRRISSEFFGYRADDSAPRRSGPAAKWRALWAPG
ncbi:MAG: armadillo/beta-catenin-like repeat-containing protein [Planctomycetota bacterium]